MFRAPHIISGWEWFPVFDWRGKPTVHEHLKRSLLSEIGMWEGLCVFCLKWNGPRDALTQKKAGFPCSGLNAGSYFISRDEGITESPMETLEKAIVLHHFLTEGLTSFTVPICTLYFQEHKFSYSGNNAFYILGSILLIFSLFLSSIQFDLLNLLWSLTLLWLIIVYILKFIQPLISFQSFTVSHFLITCISSLFFIYNFIYYYIMI